MSISPFMSNDTLDTILSLVNNPQDVFRRLIYDDYPLIYNTEMHKYSISGHINIVTVLYSLGANNLDNCANAACQNGHIDILIFMMNNGANQYSRFIKTACKHGHINIVNLLLNKCTFTSSDHNECLRIACDFNQEPIISIMAERI